MKVSVRRRVECQGNVVEHTAEAIVTDGIISSDASEFERLPEMDEAKLLAEKLFESLPRQQTT